MRTAKCIMSSALALVIMAGFALAQTSSTPPSGSPGAQGTAPGDKKETKSEAEDTKRMKIPAADKPKGSPKK